MMGGLWSYEASSLRKNHQHLDKPCSFLDNIFSRAINIKKIDLPAADKREKKEKEKSTKV
ncbi:MAG: hypothetical protein SAK29_11020 [Scytonema sp. PMC 1069.18]|nr:hypothetical protein [Scytonema sp. PMC 1069.18]MEC4882616.1 hypothetical protein [Scytonema sp. PMC 1070.18]